MSDTTFNTDVLEHECTGYGDGDIKVDRIENSRAIWVEFNGNLSRYMIGQFNDHGYELKYVKTNVACEPYAVFEPSQ
jgi:hypothetical protein